MSDALDEFQSIFCKNCNRGKKIRIKPNQIITEEEERKINERPQRRNRTQSSAQEEGLPKVIQKKDQKYLKRPGNDYLEVDICNDCFKELKTYKYFPFSRSQYSYPGLQPEIYKNVSRATEYLIALKQQTVTVFTHKGPQLKYSANAVCITVDHQNFIQQIPKAIPDLEIIVCKRKVQQNPKIKDLEFNKQQFIELHQQLEKDNFLYRDIPINMENLDSLPEDGQIPLDNLEVIILEEEVPDTQSKKRSFDHIIDNNQVQEEIKKNSELDNIPDREHIYHDQEIQNADNFEEHPGKNTFCESVQNEITLEQAKVQCPILKPNEVLEPVKGQIAQITEPHLMAKSFPLLFPSGRGCPFTDLFMDSSKKEPKAYDRINYLLWFAEPRNGKLYYRFASHPTFAYVALQYDSRLKRLYDTNFTLQQSNLDSKYTLEKLYNFTLQLSFIKYLEELKKKVQDNDSEVMRFIHQSTKSDAGTPSYWINTRRSLETMVDQLGLPTLFFTQSSADHHNNTLQRLIDRSANGVMNIAKNPHIASHMFMQTYALTYEYFFQKMLGAQYVWVRFEFQSRGSIHLHGFAKIKEPRPGLSLMTEIMKINEFRIVETQKLIDDQELQIQANQDVFKESTLLNTRHTSQQQIYELGQFKTKFDRKLAAYSDWIGINANLASTQVNQKWKTWKRGHGSVHPAAKEYLSFTQGRYLDLANTVQNHQCGPYCKKKDQQCRFNFPKSSQDDSSLNYIKTKKLTDIDYFVTCDLKRNEASKFINQHNVAYLMSARANVDMKVMYCNKLALMYVTKYCCKCEIKSEQFKKVRQTLLNQAQREVTSRGILQSAVFSHTKRRDWSQQELFMLADMPWNQRELYRTDIQNIYINLNEKYTIQNKWKKKTQQNQDDQHGVHKLILAYGNRNEYPLKTQYDNDKYRFITFKYYQRSFIQKLLDKSTSNQQFINCLKIFIASKFKQEKKRIEWKNLPMVEFYKYYAQ